MRRRVPAVLIPGDPALPGIASVTFDVAESIAQATRRLLELGHRRIAFIGGAPDSLFHRALLAAFERALAESGMAADPALVAETNFTPAEGAERAHDLLTLADPPTAVMSSGDLIAQGALATAQKLGLRVPADLSIVSLSALPGQRIPTPGIAAVVSDFEEAGALSPRLHRIAEPYAETRDRAENVIDVGYDRREIVAGVKKQLAHGRYPSSHLYGDGGAGARIAKILIDAPLRVQTRLSY